MSTARGPHDDLRPGPDTEPAGCRRRCCSDCGEHSGTPALVLAWVCTVHCRFVFHIAWVFLLYELLKVVNRRLSVFALLVIIVGCAIQAVASVLYLGPMLVLSVGGPLSAFTAEQLRALAFVFIRFQGDAFNTYLVFFGLWCLLTGFLIFRSSFLPRILGILLAISGLGWLMFFYPPLANRLFMPYIAGASAIGEIPLELWLIVAGVNSERWMVQAATTVDAHLAE